MNIRSWAGSLCLLALPLAATATEPAASPFPDRPYLLQFKRSLPATSPTPSAPGRGMTPSLSMGPGGSCNPEMSADCERVDMGGAGWTDFGAYALAREPERRVQLYGKADKGLGAICQGEVCRSFLWPSDVPFERSAGATVVGIFFDTVIPVCVVPKIRSFSVDQATGYLSATEAAREQLAGQTVTIKDIVHVRYIDSGLYKFIASRDIIGDRLVLKGPQELSSSADTPCKP